jgi:hypothetical protein
MNNINAIPASEQTCHAGLLIDELASDPIVRPELQKVARIWRGADPVDAARDAQILADTLQRNHGLAVVILDDPRTSGRLRKVLSDWLGRTDKLAAESDALLLFRACTEWADHELDVLIRQGPNT